MANGSLAYLGGSWRAANDEVYGEGGGIPYSNPKHEQKKILSLTGGGVRGVVTLEALAQLEEKTGKPVCDLFDMMVGTSTGGIIALALAKNKHTGKPTMSARELQKFYIEHSADIFEVPLWRRIISGNGLLTPKISPDVLKTELEKKFGHLKLSDLETQVTVVAVDAETNDLHLFRSHPSGKDKDFYLVDAAMGTSAAPTYFPKHEATSMSGEKHIFIDGGIQKNNPVIVAYGESKKFFGDKNFFITSIGTGDDSHNDQKLWAESKSKTFRPAKSVIDRMFEGQVSADEKILSHFPDVEMVSINPRIDQTIKGLPPADTNLAAGSKANLENMVARSAIELKKDETNSDSGLSRLFKKMAEAEKQDVECQEECKIYAFPKHTIGSELHWQPS